MIPDPLWKAAIANQPMEINWKDGLHVDLADLWRYAENIAVHHWAFPSSWRFNVDRKYSTQIGSRNAIFYGTTDLYAIFFAPRGGHNVNVEYDVKSIRTRGGVILTDVDDIKEFLSL